PVSMVPLRRCTARVRITTLSLHDALPIFTFGLVNVPVKMFTAVRDRGIHFHMLSEDGSCRLRRKLVCPDTGREYEYAETTRGFRSEEHTSELQSRENLVCRLLLEKKKN